MRINVDREGGNLLLKICDAALRAAGVNVLNDVNIVLNEVRKSENLELKEPANRSETLPLVHSNVDGNQDADSLRTGAKTPRKA